MTNEEAIIIEKAFERGVVSQAVTGGPLQEQLRDALKKQIPMRVQRATTRAITSVQAFICPACGGYFTLAAASHCWHCGQKLDWNGGTS